MADDMEEEHGTSDENVDPYCDTCFETKGLNVKVYGYCKDCFQFLCSDCHVFHDKFQVAKSHVILQGSSMPQSQADKPPKFHHCDNHPALVKDQFCCEHNSMVCSSCSFNHSNCLVQSIEDVCKNISSSEIDSLYDTVKDLQDQVRSVMLSVETTMKKVKEKRKSMLKKAQTFYDRIISKANKLYQDMQSDIEANCQSQILLMSQHQEKIKAMVAKLESSMTDIEKFEGKSIDTKCFLKIQENVNNINLISGEFRSLEESMVFVKMTFIPSEIIENFLSISFTLGSVLKAHIKPYNNMLVNDLAFPSTTQPPDFVTPPQLSSGYIPGGAGLLTRPVTCMKDAKQIRSLSRINATKQFKFRVKQKDDNKACLITGFALTDDGRILMADKSNSKVKMFSHDIDFLTAVSVPERPWYMFLSSDGPWDVAVISDMEAVATIDDNSLVVLDISCNQLQIKATTKVPYSVRGITKYNNKLAISSIDPTPSVKLIDLTGKVYWSVPSDQHGQSLFNCPLYLTSHDEGRSSTVIVTDEDNNTLTLLNGETGEIITRRQLQGTYPCGVTTDTDGNVYVCYRWTNEVSVLSRDLSEDKILLTGQNGLSLRPQANIYDKKAHQLLISYYEKDIVHKFKLSKLL